MQYLLMIYSDETAPDPGLTSEYMAFTQDIVKSGAFKAGDRLKPSSTATTVRIRDGKTMITDGPFAESREQLGGYYLVEAPDLDGAIAWARKIPGGPNYAVEVRPIHVM